MAGRKQQNTSPVRSPSDDTDTGMGMLDSASLKDQDRFLPIANVSRIMKKALPTNAKISKEAKETVQECVSEFISFITGEASDKCQREKRKTINGDDLLWAMTTLGFENYVGPLKVYLSKYRETEEEKNSMARQGDQSPVEDTRISTNGNTHHFQAVHGNNSLSGSNGTFFSLGNSTVGTPSSYGEPRSTVMYGENPKINGAFFTSESYDKGDKNASTLYGVNQQNGLVWY